MNTSIKSREIVHLQAATVNSELPHSSDINIPGETAQEVQPVHTRSTAYDRMLAHALKEYQEFCALRSWEAFPLTLKVLTAWIATGTFTKGGLHQSTVAAYIHALCITHSERRLALDVFAASTMIHSIQPRDNIITHEMVAKMVTNGSTTVTSINVKTAFVLAFSFGLRPQQFTSTSLEEGSMLTRRDVYFVNGFAHCRVDHVPQPRSMGWRSVPATNDATCPVNALRALFTVDPQPDSAPLFRLSQGYFNRNLICRMLQRRLQEIGVKDPHMFNLYSFRNSANE